ncbi:hypothetical protein GQ457_16G002150 [Hibiscus cannabinus]
MECATDTFRFESTPLQATTEKAAEEDDWRSLASTTTTSSSSIGKNSDDDVSGRSSDGGGCDENEVQSPYEGGLNMTDSLQQVLPMRRGISSFYDGKSKSFTSLADACAARSIKEIAKPENAYTRRRRNLLAINHLWDKNRNIKRHIRPISSSKSTLALAVAMSSSESISSTSDDSTSPLHPQNTPSLSSSCGRNLSNWRSFSLADVWDYNTVVIGSTNPDCVSFHD